MEWLTAVGLVSTVVLYDIMATVAFCAGRVTDVAGRGVGPGPEKTDRWPTLRLHDGIH